MSEVRFLSVVGAALAALVLAGCGGDDEGAGDQLDEITACLQEAGAEATPDPGASVLGGAVGTIDVESDAGPLLLHVFEDEAAAAAYHDPKAFLPSIAVGNVLVDDDDEAAIKLVEGCL